MKYLLIVLSIILLSNQSTSAQIVDTVTISPIESYKLNNDYVERLSNLADFYYGSGNYEKAINIGNEKTAILFRLYGDNNVEYALSLAESAYYYYSKGDNETSIALTMKSLKILEDKGMEESLLFAILSNHLSLFLAQKDKNKSSKYKKNAARLFNTYLSKDYYKEIIDNAPSNIYSIYTNTKESLLFQNAVNEYKTLQYDSINYAIDIFIKETYPNAEKGNYLKAIESSKETLRLLYKWAGESYEKYWLSLELLSIYYEETGNFEESFQICENYLNLTKKYCGELSAEYVESISNYAFRLYKGDEYAKAVEIEQKAIEISSSMKDSLHLAKALSHVGSFHKSLGHIDRSVVYNKKALSILASQNQQLLYAETLSDLSDSYLRLGKYENAFILIEKAISLSDYQSKEYYHFISNLANCYYYTKDYEKAISLLEEVCAFKERQSNVEDLSLSSSLDNLALYYSKIGRLRDAISTQERSIDIKRKRIGKDNMLTAKSISDLGYLYILLGDKNRGVELEEKAAQIIRDNEGTYCLDYVLILRKLSSAYSDLKKKVDALEEAKTIIEEMELDDPSTIIEIYGELAYNYACLGNREKVIKFEKSINKKVALSYFKENEELYANYMHKIANCYSALGDFEKSNEIEKSVLEYFKKTYGDNISVYEDKISRIVINYANLSDTTNLLRIIKETNILDCAKKEMVSNISSLPFKQRNDLWTYVQKTFVDAIPLLASITEDDYIISCAYDISALFAKNILLKTEISLSELIEKYGDNKMKEELKCFITNKSKLCISSDRIEEDSLVKIINHQEDMLRMKMNDLGLLNQKENYSWKDIQSKMSEKDMVIEFLCFDNGEYGQFVSALLLKKDYTNPKLIKIGPADMMSRYYYNNQRDSLYDSIWGVIETELDDVNNIYFSPAGPIYHIPIEYLPNSEGIFLCEKYNIFRVSSTQNIVNKKVEKDYKSSVLYGGLDYEYENTEVQDTNYYHISVDRGIRDVMSNRNGFEKLLYTKEEITEISNLLSQSNINCWTYMGINGIEESFKKLSGKSIDIIHMSTHGMFVERDKVKEQRVSNNYSFIIDDYSPIQYEDAALSRSFLVMSGGNMLSKHIAIPDGVEDGILTAQEIAALDFRGLDLVVLSACQTALGDINNEGVYGLQRGFKKAGANTILMSIDKVNDEATKILMVEFYKNLINGKTKHQSLKDAQKYLRHVDNGKYDKPEYWASFIMLDGLN